MQITGDLNDEYLIMSMISRHDSVTLETFRERFLPNFCFSSMEEFQAHGRL